MIVVTSYALAVFFCVITMTCWGSWANTQKMAAKTWRFELFDWDFVAGLVLSSLLAALTLGSWGSGSRAFIPDLMQADLSSIGFPMLGGLGWSPGTLLVG